MKKLIFFFVLFAALLIAGCDKMDFAPQPQIPQQADLIDNTSGATLIAQGESVSLKAKVTSSLSANVWSVNGEVVATTPTFVFSNAQTGKYTISLTVLSEGVLASDQIVITV